MARGAPDPTAPTLIQLDDARSGVPRSVPPMRPRLASGPFNSREHLFEVKWDGVRALMSRDREGVRVVDRTGADLLVAIPELRDAKIPEGVLLDGEIVVCDGRGRPSYDLLAGRLGPRAVKRGRGPIFVAFDLLYEAHRPLLRRPLEERRSRLLSLDIRDRRVAVPEHLEDDGEPFFDAVEEYGLEGIVAKKRRSPYVPAGRTADWLKLHVTPRADIVIGGVVVDERRGARSLLCGWTVPGGLEYAGEAYIPPFLARWVDEATRGFATDRSAFLAPIGLRPGLRWLRPLLVAVVEHGGAAGRELEDARFKVLRLDGDPANATREEPVDVPSEPPSGPAERPRLVVLHSLPFGPIDGR